MSPILYFKQTLEGKEWIYKYNPLYIPIGIVRGVIVKAEDYSFFYLIKIFILALFLALTFVYTIRKKSKVLNLYVDK